MDWVISSQALNRGGFNDYPGREYTISDGWWKRYAPVLSGEDIVCTCGKP